MNIHELKTDPKYFQAVNYGSKKAEIRNNDRDYQVGDILVIRAFDREANQYVTNWWLQDNPFEEHPCYVNSVDEACYLLLRVTHVLTSDDFPQGLQNGYVMLSFEKIEREGE